MTLQLAMASLVLGLILGLLGAAAKLSPFALLRQLGNGYSTLMRGLPEFLVVLTFYFGASQILMAVASWFGYDEYIEVSAFTAGTAALGFIFGAYASELFRGAILAIPPGQREAAQALGMSNRNTFFRITMPQMWRVALPGLGNLFMILMKDTALVSVVGLEELMRVTAFAVGHTKEPFTFYLAAALIYLAMTAVATYGISRLEKRANIGVRSAAR
ncbi:putative ABC-type basic amino acid transporter inner membrane subunit [Magnetospira sp. QH-2]|nr:putative ABC-type basic amino acid transporter inner membrane subunit [Magnetospira sp. QH-2]